MTTQNEDVPDARGQHLRALEQVLRGHRLVADLTAGTHIRVSRADLPSCEITVRCAPRASDNGLLWFLGPGDLPLGPVDQMHVVIPAIKRLTSIRIRM